MHVSFDSLNGHRDAVKRLGVEAGGALKRQSAILNAQPHAGDIATAFQDRIDELAATFEAQVLSYPAKPIGGLADDLGTAAIAYFCREMIAMKLPTVIERLRPEAKTGLTPQQRRAALSEVGAVLGKIWHEREALTKAIGLDMIVLRDLRQQAMHERDAAARGAIETAEMDVALEMQALRADQERVHAAMSVVR